MRREEEEEEEGESEAEQSPHPPGIPHESKVRTLKWGWLLREGRREEGTDSGVRDWAELGGHGPRAHAVYPQFLHWK